MNNPFSKMLTGYGPFEKIVAGLAATGVIFTAVQEFLEGNPLAEQWEKICVAALIPLVDAAVDIAEEQDGRKPSVEQVCLWADSSHQHATSYLEQFAELTLPLNEAIENLLEGRR